MTAGVPYSSAQALYVGEQIRQARNDLRLTQRDVADWIGMHPSTFALWEQDRRPVPYARLGLLAIALRFKPDEWVAPTGPLPLGSVDERWAFDPDDAESEGDSIGRPQPLRTPAPPARMQKPIKHWWILSCVLCGRGTEKYWTKARLEQVGPLRCDVCGGRILVDPAPLVDRSAVA